MALCLADSLIACKGFDPLDQMKRYLRWYREGYLSCRDRAFGIGNTVRGALERFAVTGEAFSGPSSPDSAGDGSLMRLAPVPMYFAATPATAIEESGRSSMTTHQAPEAVDACKYFAGLIVGALKGEKKDVLVSDRYSPIGGWKRGTLRGRVDQVASGSFKMRGPPDIRGTGYVVECLEAALWAFHNSASFKEGALLAVNLCDDADTTGAVYGQLAGAHYGYDSIPSEWSSTVAMSQRIVSMANQLHRLSGVS
jgi:ADP-ribosylglycohydrolase